MRHFVYVEEVNHMCVYVCMYVKVQQRIHL